MNKSYFEILRSGTHTTMQDNGRYRLYHLGIAVSGAMDTRNFMLVNSLVKNKINEPAIEFAYQGPLLKLINGTIDFAISGNVIFSIIRKDLSVEEGKCYQNYILNEGEQIDIISTTKSVYGYLAINGGFQLEKIWNSGSINTKANIGPNNGKKYLINERIFIKKSSIKSFSQNKIDFKNQDSQIIRVLEGTNFNYFSEESKRKFFSEEYLISNLTDRMGMRLEGPSLTNIINTNIKSEGLVKGVIQVPADGQPIILLSDHGTIGGYPKIAVVVSADYDKLVQKIPNTKINFECIKLNEAEKIFKDYQNKTSEIIKRIK